LYDYKERKCCRKGETVAGNLKQEKVEQQNRRKENRKLLENRQGSNILREI
jgi:hypothetical protein